MKRTSDSSEPYDQPTVLSWRCAIPRVREMLQGCRRVPWVESPKLPENPEKETVSRPEQEPTSKKAECPTPSDPQLTSRELRGDSTAQVSAFEVVARILPPPLTSLPPVTKSATFLGFAGLSRPNSGQVFTRMLFRRLCCLFVVMGFAFPLVA